MRDQFLSNQVKTRLVLQLVSIICSILDIIIKKEREIQKKL